MTAERRRGTEGAALGASVVDLYRQGRDPLQPDELQHYLAHPLAYGKEDANRDKLGRGLALIQYFPPDAPRLEAIYRQLTKTIRATTAPFVSRIAAVALADTIIHQTNLPIDEKIPVVESPDDASRDETRRFAKRIRANEQATPQSKEAYNSAEASVSSFMRELAERQNTVPTTIGEAHQELVDLDMTERVFLEAHLREMWEAMGSRERFTAATTYLWNRSIMLMTEEPVTDLLTEGQLDDMSSDGRFRLFIAGFISSNAQHNDVTQERGQKFRNYFLNQNFIQERFWESITREVRSSSPIISMSSRIESSPAEMIPAEYIAAEGFFLHDEQAIRSFLETFPEGIITPKQRRTALQKLIGFAALFQGSHKGHDNAPFVREAIADLATKLEARNTVATSLAILADEQHGSIIARKPFAVDVRPTLSGHPDEQVLYASKKTSEAATQRPLRKNEQIFPADNILLLTEGTVETHAMWGDLFVPAPESIPAIVTRLHEQYTPDDETALMNWTDAQRTIAKSDRPEAAVFVGRTPVTHPLENIADLGIIAVHREDSKDPTQPNIVVVIDGEKAGMQPSDGSQRICLQGRLKGDLFELDNAPEEFEFSPLQLALTGLAQLTHLNESVPSINIETANRVKAQIQNWNSEHRPPFKEVKQLKSTEMPVFFPVTDPESKNHPSVALLTLR